MRAATRRPARRRARGGLYLWRVRKPHAVLGLPIIGRHNGYGGMTNSYSCRELEHLTGRSPRLRSSQYKLPATWSDLEPRCYRVLPLPDWLVLTPLGRRIVKGLETVLIAVTCPVYNETQQAPWNMRRIRPRRAAAMRAERDRHGRKAAGARFALRCLIYVMILTVAILMWRWAG